MALVASIAIQTRKDQISRRVTCASSDWSYVSMREAITYIAEVTDIVNVQSCRALYGSETAA